MAELSAEREERWSLTSAVNALVESARQAAYPGWIWLAGILYPSLNLGLGSGFELQLAFFVGSEPLQEALVGVLVWLVLSLPVVLLLFRLTVGLARVSPPRAWAEASAGRPNPSLRTVWNAGRGLTLAAFGLWLQLFLMHLAALVVVGVPAWLVRLLLESGGSVSGIVLLVALLAPLFVLSLFYVLVLAVLLQLGLHSLIQNRRGVGSALAHAWRLARHDPGATGRAILVDVLLWITIQVLTLAASLAMSLVCLGFLPWIVLAGYMGVTRAGYWARVYRALGGLSPRDGVPGL